MEVTKSSSVFKSGNTTCRTLKTFCKNMGKIDKGSRNFTNCDSIRNTNVIKALAKVCSNKERNFADRIGHDRKRRGRLLSKGSITSVLNQEGYQILSTELFLVPEKNESQRPVIYLKHLNKFIPYNFLKMAGSHCLKEILLEGDYMYKIDLKDTYF